MFRPAHYDPELGALPTRAAAVVLRTAHLAFPLCEELMDLLFLADGHLAALAEATTMDSSFFRLRFLAMDANLVGHDRIVLAGVLAIVLNCWAMIRGGGLRGRQACVRVRAVLFLLLVPCAAL